MRYIPFFIFMALIFSLNQIHAQEITLELKNQIASYQKERARLRKELKKIKPGAPLAQWKEQNRERIQKQRRVAEQIRTQLRRAVRENYDSIQMLPPEEREAAKNAWFEKNKIYVSAMEQSGPIDKGETKLQHQLREIQQKRKSEIEDERMQHRHRNRHQTGVSSQQTADSSNPDDKTIRQ